MRVQFMACLLLAACQQTPAPKAPRPAMPAFSQQAKPFPLTLRDQLDRTVTVRAKPLRIVSLSPALTEILFAVGCGDRLVLRDGWSDFPPEVQKVAAVTGFDPSAEAILSVRPDLVLAHFPPPNLRGALEAARVPWLGFAPQTLAEVSESMRAVARACGNGATGELEVQRFEKRLAEIHDRVAHLPAPKVFYELDSGIGGRPYTISRKAFGNAVLEAAGGRNVFADAEVPWFQVSPESILAADPDIVLKADADSTDSKQLAETLARRPGMSALRAVRLRHVVALRPDWVSRPGPRLVLGVEQIAKALHPEAFPAVAAPVAP